ncbi:YpmS family protein [Enterococcus timonensis]|uniref:YpmS family protein n=1 Tax=Enterococcus timonensis TaxID=1852364 RepID=UPI000A5126B5|nr:YpmS family protein [Enterococcus timonensis]
MENNPEEKTPEKTARSKTKSKMTLKRKINGWKIATLLMIGLILGSGFYLFSIINTDREDDYKPAAVETVESSTQILELSTDKTRVNELIDHYLVEYLSNEDIKYEFYLENQALLKGTFELLGYPLNFYLYFEPYVMENGNVQLKAKSVSIGALGIPVKEVLRYVRSNFELPEWIEINLDEETMILHLDQFKLAADLKIAAEKIDLVDDDIRFTLNLATSESEAEK